MPDLSHPSSQLPANERETQAKGIDFPRAYHALIKGFVRLQVARKLKGIEHVKDEQGEQQ